MIHTIIIFFFYIIQVLASANPKINSLEVYIPKENC